MPELTKLVLELRERVARFEGGVEDTEPTIPPSIGQPPETRGMGRKPKLPKAELLKRRNRLSDWLEQSWPNLAEKLLAPQNAAFAAYAFVKEKKKLPGVFQPPFYHDPEKYKEELWEFLRSRRYGGNPRNLAGAMAGLPELSWKRSLDVSQMNPITRPLHEAAWRDHLRRHFPNRFRELKTVATEKEVKEILAKSKSQDITYRHLKEHPEAVLKWVCLHPPVQVLACVCKNKEHFSPTQTRQQKRWLPR